MFEPLALTDMVLALLVIIAAVGVGRLASDAPRLRRWLCITAAVGRWRRSGSRASRMPWPAVAFLLVPVAGLAPAGRASAAADGHEHHSPAAHQHHGSATGGIGVAGLALAITGLTAAVGMPELQSILWPTGSGVIVGLIYVSEGAFRRNVLHYVLGTWLVLVAGAALMFDVPTLFWVLAVAGGGAFAVATVLEYSRTAAPGRTAAVAGS